MAKKKKDDGYPTATVEEVNGQLVLNDPQAVAMFKAVEKHNCKATFDMNADRVQHFKNRITEKELTPKDVVITVINVDDPNGGPIADVLMPNYNWQEIRDQGQIPFARGLAQREGIQSILEEFDKDAAKKLKELPEGEVAVVVVDHGVAEIFTA